MSEIVEIKNLTKKYGNFIAVDGLSLKINSGEVFGILGPNGSGKTTTLGMLLGVINETSGSYSWFGKTDFENCRKQIGSILEHPIFYPELTAYRNLEIASMIKGCDKNRIDIVLERVGLLDRKMSNFNTYSLGMKQRLALASALLSDPDVLVLDEPTNGLDPEGINYMRELILSIAAEGKTIIISSHLLDEIQKMCSHVAIMKNGKLIKTGSIASILSDKKHFEINSKHQGFEERLSNLSFITSYTKETNHYLITCDEYVDSELINKKCFEAGIVLNHLVLHKESLEAEFLNLVQK
jgi:ABC-2 type transport system ATP-binding protein